MNIKVTANYVVYNEKLLLPLSIASLYDHVDEIVVVDNESTDGTVDTLEPFMDKVKLLISPSKNFSSLRNLALENSKDATVIVKFDADEILYEKFAKNLHNIAEEMLTSDLYRARCWFYHMLGDLENMHNNALEARDWQYQRDFMYKNMSGSMKWLDAVHEAIVGIPNEYMMTNYFYMHLGYVKPQRMVFERWKLYSDLVGNTHVYDGVDPDHILDDRLRIPYDGPLPEVLQEFLDNGGKLEWE
jgi:glycosyltransferase involved in cell wall biosynthesis